MYSKILSLSNINSILIQIFLFTDLRNRLSLRKYAKTMLYLSYVLPNNIKNPIKFNNIKLDCKTCPQPNLALLYDGTFLSGYYGNCN